MERDEQFHILALRKGSRKSFKWIFERYKFPVYTYVRSLLKSDKWTEDISAEVFISIWEHRQKLRSATFKSYIFQIARNRAFNQLKKIAADTLQEEEYVRHYQESVENAEDREEANRTRKDLLEIEIKGLPPKRKEIIERKYFLGQKNAQIAEDMGISINTVKVHLYKARVFLRSRLGESEGKV